MADTIEFDIDAIVGDVFEAIPHDAAPLSTQPAPETAPSAPAPPPPAPLAKAPAAPAAKPQLGQRRGVVVAPKPRDVSSDPAAPVPSIPTPFNKPGDDGEVEEIADPTPGLGLDTDAPAAAAPPPVAPAAPILLATKVRPSTGVL